MDEGMNAIVVLFMVALAVVILSAMRVVAKVFRHDWDNEGMLDVDLATYAIAVGALTFALAVLFVAWAEPQRSIAPRTYWLLVAARDVISALSLSLLAFHEMKTASWSRRWVRHGWVVTAWLVVAWGVIVGAGVGAVIRAVRAFHA